MAAQPLDPVFVSHGSPMLALDPGEAGEFWARLASYMPKPTSILCVSAHWTTREPAVSGADRPETIHDFYGFPEPLYRLSYAPPGAPTLAQRVKALLGSAGVSVAVDDERGLDHGAWVPLRSLYPAADVPVTQLSVQPYRDAAWHRRLGAALSPLREEGVLILGSGGATHNLGELRRAGGAPSPWAVDFDEWLAAALRDGREGELLDWVHTAPQALRSHPSPEHFLPLFVAWGAAGLGARGARIYEGFSLGSLSMAAYRFAA